MISFDEFFEESFDEFFEDFFEDIEVFDFTFPDPDRAGLFDHIPSVHFLENVFVSDPFRELATAGEGYNEDPVSAFSSGLYLFLLTELLNSSRREVR